MYAQTLALLALAASSAISAPVNLSSRALSGTATYYAVGLGNCGWESSPGDHVVAIPTARYGSTSEKSGLCGQMVHITNTNTGQTANAKIVDSCPTCVSSGSLDMSEGLFTSLGGTTEEGVFPISWTFGTGESQDNSDSSSSASSDSNSNTQTQTASVAIIPPNSTVVPAITAKPNNTVATVPTWWATIDSSSCAPAPAPAVNETVVAIGPSANTQGHPDLTDACGRWVSVVNPANNKNITAKVAAVYPNEGTNFLVLSTGYPAIADVDEGGMAVPVANATWGFIQ